MQMDWNWWMPSESDFLPRRYYKLRYRPLREWRWHRIIFWFVTLPLMIFVLVSLWLR